MSVLTLAWSGCGVLGSRSPWLGTTTSVLWASWQDRLCSTYAKCSLFYSIVNVSIFCCVCTSCSFLRSYSWYYQKASSIMTPWNNCMCCMFYCSYETMTWIHFLHFCPFVKGSTSQSNIPGNLKMLLNKQSSCQWFEVPRNSCDVTVMILFYSKMSLKHFLLRLI